MGQVEIVKYLDGENGVTNKIKKAMKENIFYTVPEVAKLLRTSDGNIYNMVKKNEIPNTKIGCRCIIPKKELEKWLNEHLYGTDETIKL